MEYRNCYCYYQRENNMAIIIHGRSLCSICKKVLKEKNDIIGWPHFLSKEYELWQYSDSGMHRSCFEKWEHKEEFLDLYRYRPLTDFEDPELKKHIEKFGMPDWMKDVIEYRKNKS